MDRGLRTAEGNGKSALVQAGLQEDWLYGKWALQATEFLQKKTSQFLFAVAFAFVGSWLSV
jgi:hypothetical protein